VVVVAMNRESLIVRREVKEGMYGPLSYVLVTTLLQLPWMVILAAAALCPAGYGIGNFPWARFDMSLLVMIVIIWVCENLAQLCSLGPNVLMNMMNYLNGFSVFMLFSGLLLQTANVIWPLRLLAYISPMRYLLELFVYYVFIDAEYTGAVTDPSAPRGFSCPGADSQLGCYGHTGEQVLGTLHLNYEVANPNPNIGLLFGICIGEALLFKLVYTLQFVMLCRTAAVPAPPTKNTPLRESANEAAMASNEKPTAPMITPSDARSTAGGAGEPTTGGVELKIIDIQYSVMVSKDGRRQPKHLLQGVSASVATGEVLALMGPSGAGKTTLLNVLTLEKGTGTATGSVTLNGHPFTLDVFRKHAAIVNQTDELWAFLTTREHLEYACALYQPSASEASRGASVDRLLADTGLEAAQHTKAGNELFKGLSGGQKRRLSLAVALCKAPRVVFLDEPTSGLDAASAASVMQFLKATAARTGVAVICTIHQPSSAVFDGFDSVCFLTGGRVAYLGKAAELPAYLGSVGHPLEGSANPADRMLDLINKDFSDAAAVEDMLVAWAKRAPSIQAATGMTALAEPDRPGCGVQLASLLSKHTTLVLRDPTIYLGRLPVAMSGSSFIAILYIHTRFLDQGQVLDRLFFATFGLVIPGLLALVTVVAQHGELGKVTREIQDGMYSPMLYVLVTTMLQLPAMLLLALGSIFPAGYGLGNWAWEGFGQMLLIFTCTQWCVECIAQCLGAFHPNVLLNMMIFMITWFVAFLFNGIALPIDAVIWPFRIFCSVLPYRWSQAAMTYTIFHFSPDYQGAAACNVTTMLPINVPINVTTTVACDSTTLDADGHGFYCPGREGAACYGRTGSQLLNSIGHTFTSIEADVDWPRSCLYILLIALFFKLQFAALVVLKSTCGSSSRSIRPSASSNGIRAPPAVDDEVTEIELKTRASQQI